MFQTLPESDPLSISDMSIKNATRPFFVKRVISTGRNLPFPYRCRHRLRHHSINTDLKSTEFTLNQILIL